MAERMRCPKCGNWRTLSLLEIHSESGATDFGVIRLDSETGAMIPPTKFYFVPGDPIATYITCDECRHEWKPRQQSIASWIDPEPHEYGPDD